jgi:hypothetical protein
MATRLGSRHELPRFDRRFLASGETASRIGGGQLGGKAHGLLAVRSALEQRFAAGSAGIEVAIPRFTVVATDVFDAFMDRNHLYDLATSDATDERIAHAFQLADLPAGVLGDLRSVANDMRTPLAVRSSSLLEDALFRPFAGVYGTKMLPNNQHDPDARFRRLTEAVKLVYASTFFQAAKGYIAATEHSSRDEKMAVVIQEVVGRRHGDRFYPELSGVGRSFNFYPTGPGRPEDGVISLALGLGKTIVDGGVCWSYSPAHPANPPPFASPRDMLGATQVKFWAINMGRPPGYDPTTETEYLVEADLKDADYDDVLRHLASTYVAQSDRLVPGTGAAGPRVLDFAPLLRLEAFPVNAVARDLLGLGEEVLGTDVEMEFALTFSGDTEAARLGLLQVRPMVVPDAEVTVEEHELAGASVLASSTHALGNGAETTIADVVYVMPDRFDAAHTRQIASEIAERNAALVSEARPYLLIGFGRWGSSDPWLGIPVQWGQIGGARAIVEATLPDMDVEISQGSHFFHNLSSFGVTYFAVRHGRGPGIDWAWLADQSTVAESDHVRHVRLAEPLEVKVDGRTGRGVVRHG